MLMEPQHAQHYSTAVCALHAISQAVVQSKTAVPVHLLSIIINLSGNWQGVLLKK